MKIWIGVICILFLVCIPPIFVSVVCVGSSRPGHSYFWIPSVFESGILGGCDSIFLIFTSVPVVACRGDMPPGATVACFALLKSLAPFILAVPLFAPGFLVVLFCLICVWSPLPCPQEALGRYHAVVVLCP